MPLYVFYLHGNQHKITTNDTLSDILMGSSFDLLCLFIVVFSVFRVKHMGSIVGFNATMIIT